MLRIKQSFPTSTRSFTLDATPTSPPKALISNLKPPSSMQNYNGLSPCSCLVISLWYARARSKEISRQNAHWMHHGDFEDAFALHATRQHKTHSECVIDSTHCPQGSWHKRGEKRQDPFLKCRKISYRFYKWKLRTSFWAQKHNLWMKTPCTMNSALSVQTWKHKSQHKQDKMRKWNIY